MIHRHFCFYRHFLLESKEIFGENSRPSDLLYIDILFYILGDEWRILAYAIHAI